MLNTNFLNFQKHEIYFFKQLSKLVFMDHIYMKKYSRITEFLTNWPDTGFWNCFQRIWMWYEKIKQDIKKTNPYKIILAKQSQPSTFLSFLFVDQTTLSPVVALSQRQGPEINDNLCYLARTFSFFFMHKERLKLIINMDIKTSS